MTPEPPASVASPDHQLPPPEWRAPRRRSPFRFVIWAVVLILFALLFYWIRSYKAGPAAAAGGRHGNFGPVPVVPATATRGNLGVYLTAIGNVTPVYTDNIYPEVTGLIQAVYYHEGGYVRRGQPLIDIDSAPYAAQLMQAEGTLQRDQALLAEAKMDLARYQLAWSKNAIPRQTLDDQAKLVLQDQGTVKNDQGLVNYDKVQVGFCHITSPINGRVGLRLVDPGNLVTANSTTNALVVVTQMQPITVIFTIAEGSLPEVLNQMRRGAKLPVQAWDSSNAKELAVGRLTSIDNQIDTTTGTVRMRAEFPNADGALFPNQFVNTRVLVTTLRNQTIVPTSAIQHNGDTAFVYVIRPGAGTPPKAAGQSAAPAAAQPSKSKQPLYHAVMTTVKTGVTDGNNTGVTGIQPGDVVADSGFEKLVDGSTVTLSKAGLNIQQTSVTGASPAP